MRTGKRIVLLMMFVVVVWWLTVVMMIVEVGAGAGLGMGTLLFVVWGLWWSRLGLSLKCWHRR